MGNPKSYIDGYRKSGQVLKNAARSGNRTQTKADKKLESALQAVNEKATVLDMICNGRTIQDTAIRLDIKPTKVRSLISELLESRQELIADHAEYVYNVNFLRLEHLFGKAMTAAFEQYDKDEVLRPPNSHWANLALSFIKEQNRMAEFQSRARSPLDKDDPSKANVHIYAQTIVAGDDMFKVAHENLKDVFMDKHGHRLTAPGEEGVSPDELLLMQLDNPVDKDKGGDIVAGTAHPVAGDNSNDDIITKNVSKLEDRFSKLEQKIEALPVEVVDENGQS